MDGFDVFYPDRMASRILDLGDFKTLIENVQGAIDEEEAREMAKKMAKNNFTLDDFLKTDEPGEKVRAITKYYWHVARYGAN